MHTRPGQNWSNSFRCYWVERSTSKFFFFFQAEDGIRDDLVTGVQTLLSISPRRPRAAGGSPRRPVRSLECYPGLARQLERDRKSVVQGKSVDLGGGRII